jgi:hypothetical protein
MTKDKEIKVRQQQRQYMAQRQIKTNRSIIINDGKESVQRSFIFIVLFVFMTTAYENLPKPQNVNDIQSSQEYIQQISPEITQVSTGAIEVFFGTAEGLAQTIELLFTSASTIVNGVIEFFSNPFGLLDNVTPDSILCDAWDELNSLQKFMYQTRYWLSGSDLDIETWFINDRALELGVDANQVCS